jgi:hypothetical protein
MRRTGGKAERRQRGIHAVSGFVIPNRGSIHARLLRLKYQTEAFVGYFSAAHIRNHHVTEVVAQLLNCISGCRPVRDGQPDCGPVRYLPRRSSLLQPRSRIIRCGPSVASSRISPCKSLRTGFVTCVSSEVDRGRACVYASNLNASAHLNRCASFSEVTHKVCSQFRSNTVRAVRVPSCVTRAATHTPRAHVA